MKRLKSLSAALAGRSLAMGKQIIKVNRARCDACGDILESRGEEDRKVCRCKNLMISGGNRELVRQALFISQMTEMAEFEYDPTYVDEDQM
jgi:hypothetical protein